MANLGKKYILVAEESGRILETFHTTRNVNDETVKAQICCVFGYTTDYCTIESTDGMLCPPCGVGNIDEYIDLY